MVSSQITRKSIRIESNDPAEIINTVANTIASGHACLTIHANLINASKSNPVVIDVCDPNVAPSLPPNQYTYRAYRFELDYDTCLILAINKGSSLAYSHVALQIRNKDGYVFAVKYTHRLQIDKDESFQKRIKTVSSSLSRIFKNKSRFIDYINRIAVFPYIGFVDFGNVRVCRSDFFDEDRKAVTLRTISAKILDYGKQINDIEKVDLKEQEKLVEFLRKCVNRTIKYKYKNFEISVPKGTSSIFIKFLGIPIATFTETIPHPAYFRYFRHRGISFMLNCINREDFEKWTLEKSLKCDVGLE